MAENMSLYLFGDQTYDIQPHLKDLLRHRANPVFEAFLTKAYDAIRKELYKLPDEIRNDLPRFTCVDDLILGKKGGKPFIPLDMAITCLYQLSVFISQGEPFYRSIDNCSILGLCSGALAAAAVSCSHSVLELVPLAVDAVIVAFRTGILVSDAAQRVWPSDASAQSWSIFIPSLGTVEAIPKLCEQILPLTSRPYISAYMPNGVTISGPPRSLSELVSTETFKGLGFKSVQLQGIYGPYHAPHLYSHYDVTDVVESLVPRSADTRATKIPFLSGAGSIVEGDDFGTLLKNAVEHILLQPIRWNDVLRQLEEHLHGAGSKHLSVIPIATQADQLIYTALKQTPLRTLLPNPARPKFPLPEDISCSNPGKPKLAIVGMSGRFPGAKNNDAFWDLLYEGLDVHKSTPALRWDSKTHVDPTGIRKNTSATPFGCWLDDPAEFDARFFNISPREAPQIDPAQRLALMTAYEAIEQAGIVPDATPSTRRDRVGVFYGVTSNDWMETNSAQNIDAYFIPGGNRAFIPGRINYFFKFSGPSFALDTACSSSLAGIHLACNSLWRGDIDTAIAGGTNVLTNPDFTSGLDRGHFLSRTGNCKTFDDSADGYCRGEGIGTVIIKRLDDAIADKDPILGCILGAYTNHSAESESITRPHVGAQRAVFNKILNQGAVDPYTVSYVEMHGTGTQAGDAGEMLSTLDTFAPPSDQIKRGRSSDEALYLGSAKANIGHGEAASGVSSLIKVLLMMQKNMIVPHCGIKTKINHKFPTDLHERNVNIAFKPTPWERNTNPSKPRRAFVNNFSAAGGNSALLLEDAPYKRVDLTAATDPRSHHLIAVSARSAASLQGNLRSLLQSLEQNAEIPLSKLSYTTTARRIHHQHRVMFCSSSITDACIQIEVALRDQTGMNRPKGYPQIIFTFTGQGAQYPGMGKQLFESFSLFRTEMHRLDHISQSMGFPSFLPVILSDEQQDINNFEPTAVQLASVCFQIALSKLWTSWNISPIAVVGHSLGQYAALNVAGVLLDADTVYLVGKRADLLQKKCTRDTHTMLVVKGSVDEIAAILWERTYEVACINSAIETVLAGPNGDIAAFKELLAEAGMKSTLLKVPYAFHSSQMDPALADFQKIASDVTYSKAKIPILCTLDGSKSASYDSQYLTRHSREPVNILKALSIAYGNGTIGERTTMLEIGPHPAVSGMIRAVLGPQITSLASLQRGRPAWPILGSALKNLYAAGAEIRWQKYHEDFKASHEVITLPAYSWDLKDYWMQYVNDWSLRKGDALPTSNTPQLESTTVHRVVEESNDAEKTRIIVEADIARKDLSPLVQGHEVDGIPLCTPSVYADIALSLGTYLLERYHPDQKENLVDVSDMTISKALILRAGATQQLLQAHTDVDWSSNAATTRFMSLDDNQKLHEHSRCVLRFKDRSLLQSLQIDAASVKRKMQALRDGIGAETTARFNRPMIYRAIRPLARFHDDYRAIDEIVLNSNTLEASSKLSFGSVKRGGTYHTHPAIIDSLTQSCGFTMNCNDGTDLDEEVFMNHGWGSFQIFEELDFDKKYTTYTQMAEGADKLWHGDVVVLDGEKVVAYFGKIAIQGVPRRVLKVILSIESGNKSQKSSAPKKQATPTVSAPNIQVTQQSSPVDGESHVSKIAQALSIISEESGLARTDLTDSTVFSDVGVDSLMGLTVSARFKEELDVDFDFNAMFFDYPTVGDLKALLGQPNGGGSDIASTATSTNVSSTPKSSGTGATTPASDDGPFAPKVNFQRALQIISEESGLAMDDLTDDTNFADAGVDSLLSLVIVSRLREELEIDIEHDAFFDCPGVGDLRKLLLGDTNLDDASPQQMESKPSATSRLLLGYKNANDSEKVNTQQYTESEKAALAARKKAVDDYVSRYTAGFTPPISSSLPPAINTSTPTTNVVLVTGASGSLGSHLTDQIAQVPSVSTVICLNRSKPTDPYLRQQKAMREKGIRSFDKIRPKLLVLQTDSSKPLFGLPKTQYEQLVNSVTHLIHNAWPMSAKRALAGFEPQFQIMRNLIDFARDIASQRPHPFKFSFQLISSVGVVGHYALHNEKPKILVPEARVDIDSVLPNGYGDAKWGCERMLDETLHKYPERFRAMVVRLGQIAGSKTSGYWNPMEHFGFLIKSSQTLNALPDTGGTVYWTPVNDIAGTLIDLVLSDREPHAMYHIENPVGQPWREMNAVLASALGIENVIPFPEWVERVRNGPTRNNPAATLLEFLDSNYLRMSCGGLVLDVRNALEHSKTLAKVGPVGEDVVRKYVHIWKEIGFLN